MLLDGSEEGEVRKRSRAPVLDGPYDPPDQQLDERKGPTKPSVPPGFLSPSVQQYLELGKSIPGNIHARLSYFRFILIDSKLLFLRRRCVKPCLILKGLVTQ